MKIKYMLKSNIFIFFFLITVGNIVNIHAQDIVWADKIIKSTDKFEFVENKSSQALGVPFMYQGVMNEKIDPYTEGYILNNESGKKRNTILFGFPRVVGAEQLVLGGIFNLGSINSVKIIDLDNKEIEVYRMTKGSVSKFHNFSIFFEPRGVAGVKIEIDHNKINQWNLLKGIGLAETTDPINPYPAIYDLDEFYGKEKIELNHSQNKCMVFSPKISHDSKTMYVVADCPGATDQDIWISKQDKDGKWLASQKAGFPLNNKGHNFVASIGYKDKFLLLGNAYNIDGSNSGDGVSITHPKPEGGWQIPVSISIPGIKNKNDHANFFMNGDEKIILSSIQNPDSKGDLDLYISFFDDKNKTWSAPKNLGSGINTLFGEDSPCLAEDNRTLYFSSKGYVGFGGYDLYVTERLDDTWTNWMKPRNLGALVNSKTDDYGFTISGDGKHGYYNNINFENDSLHPTDIYKINLPKTLIKEPKIEFHGKILSEKDGAGLDALVTISNENGTMQSFYNSYGKNGGYDLSIPIHDVYQITIDNEAYYRKQVDITLEHLKSNTNSDINFNLKPLPITGLSFQLNNIAFEKGKSLLSTVSGYILDSLVQELNNNRRALIEIGVHTDGKGDKKKNKILTEQRAKSVSDYLVSKGIEIGRLKFKGYGSEQPISDNETAQGRMKNRRVTVTYIGTADMKSN